MLLVCRHQSNNSCNKLKEQFTYAVCGAVRTKMSDQSRARKLWMDLFEDKYHHYSFHGPQCPSYDDISLNITDNNNFSLLIIGPVNKQDVLIL